jgi:hypothetical protein
LWVLGRMICQLGRIILLIDCLDRLYLLCDVATTTLEDVVMSTFEHVLLMSTLGTMWMCTTAYVVKTYHAPHQARRPGVFLIYQPTKEWHASTQWATEAHAPLPELDNPPPGRTRLVCDGRHTLLVKSPQITTQRRTKDSRLLVIRL